MKVWLVRFPDDTIMVDGENTSKQMGIDAVMQALANHVKENIVLTEWVPKDAPKASFGNEADVSQQVEESG